MDKQTKKRIFGIFKCLIRLPFRLVCSFVVVVAVVGLFIVGMATGDLKDVREFIDYMYRLIWHEKEEGVKVLLNQN